MIENTIVLANKLSDTTEQLENLNYLEATDLLNYNDESIQDFINIRSWKSLSDKEKIQQVYQFVRDEILFGYNEKDEITASQVLKDGIGQCNTKATLMMALLRAVGISCRFHGFTIDKALQKGAISGLWYVLAPKNILHSWVEVYYNDKWYNLEGVILDKAYLNQLQEKFKNSSTNFCGYGAFTEDLSSPEVDWNESNTYIQKLGINQDFGLYNNPDEFYLEHTQALSPLKKIMFKYIIRKSMNNNVCRIRASKE